MSQQDLLQSTLKFNNVVPLVISAIMITTSAVMLYGAMDKRLALIEQRQAEMNIKLDTLINKYALVEERYGSLALKVNTLETRAGR